MRSHLLNDSFTKKALRIGDFKVKVPFESSEEREHIEDTIIASHLYSYVDHEVKEEGGKKYLVVSLDEIKVDFYTIKKSIKEKLPQAEVILCMVPKMNIKVLISFAPEDFNDDTYMRMLRGNRNKL